MWRAKLPAAEVPESVAKMGLGRAGRVSVALSILIFFVPNDLLLVMTHYESFRCGM